MGELWLLSSLSNLASAVTLDLANTCLIHSSPSLRCVCASVYLGLDVRIALGCTGSVCQGIYSCEGVRRCADVREIMCNWGGCGSS